MSYSKGRISRDLAELALESPSAADFRRQWMAYLAKHHVGYDLSAAFSTGDGRRISTQVYAADEHALAEKISDYVSEMTVTDFHKAMNGQTVVDTDVFARDRRERLTVYREHNEPLGIRDYLTRAWLRDGTINWFTLSRTHGSPTYSPTSTFKIDDLFPIIEIGEALHAKSATTPALANWIHEARLTGAEGRVIELAQRGLSNREISQILKTSHLTVRNQLCGAYRKLNVSNRTELAFILNTDPADTSFSGPRGPLATILREKRAFGSSSRR